MMLKITSGVSAGAKLRYEGKFRYVITVARMGKLVKLKSTNNPNTMRAEVGRRNFTTHVFDTRGETAIEINPETLQPIAPPASLTNRLSSLG